MCVCVCACVRACMRACVRVCVICMKYDRIIILIIIIISLGQPLLSYIANPSRTHARTHTRTHARTHARRHTHAHSHTHVRTLAHTYAHTPPSPKVEYFFLAGRSLREKNDMGVQTPCRPCYSTAPTAVSDASVVMLVSAVADGCARPVVAANACLLH